MTWTNAGYRDVARLIAERTGLVFPPSRHAEVEAALAEIVPDVSNPDRLADLFDARGEMREELVARLTIGESYFFRDPAQFESLRTQILPELARARGGGPLRLWSAGCAAGEEPYSLAILCAELGLDAHIVGTDISRKRLSQARAASYRAWALRGATPEFIDRWFTRAGGQFRLDASIRERVVFRHLNLAEDRFPSLADGVWGMDLILCRNVLIYFDAAVVRSVAARLIDTLSEDGWLLCGASDPPISDLVHCGVVATSGGLAYRPARAGAGPGMEESLPDLSSVAGPEPDLASPVPANAPPDSPPAASVTSGAPRADGDLEAAIERAYHVRDYPAVDALADRLREAAETEPRSWVLLVRALANRGCLGEAAQAAASALERHGDSAELLYLYGVVLSETGRQTAAISALRRCLYVDPSLAVAHLALADARARAGDAVSERRSLRNAQALLAAMPADSVVPASDGQRAGRLVRLVGARLALESDAA